MRTLDTCILVSGVLIQSPQLAGASFFSRFAAFNFTKSTDSIEKAAPSSGVSTSIGSGDGGVVPIRSEVPPVPPAEEAAPPENNNATTAKHNSDSIGSNEEVASSGGTASVGSHDLVDNAVTIENGVPQALLANSNRMPLIGLGVGGIRRIAVPTMISEALQDNKKTYLIDASHGKDNEGLVAEGILQGVRNVPGKTKVEVHVITKVWYTYLGYERTKRAVEESLQVLKPAYHNEKVDLKIHVLLQWPKCFNNIPWMHCAQEEEELSQTVKDLGPDPSANPDKAWKESWKSLEDMYLSDKYPIASIGLSNFQLHEMESMGEFVRVHPHFVQLSLWSLLYDPLLVEYCHKRKTHVQVYHAFQSTIGKPEAAPRAYHHIQKTAIELTAQSTDVTPAQVILAWLIQHGLSVVPGTADPKHLAQNSAVALTNVPVLTDVQIETVAHAVEAYLSNDDLEQDIYVSVSFHAVTKDMVLYWMGSEGEETRIKLIRKGDSFQETTYPNHKFRTYLATNKDVYLEHEIRANFGEHKNFFVEL